MNYEDDMTYELVLEWDNTLKQFFDRFYVIPKELDFEEQEIKTFEKYAFVLSDPRVRAGKDGYIVERKGKKLNNEQVQIIKNDSGSQRAKAKKYGLSVCTVNKIMNNKY